MRRKGKVFTGVGLSLQALPGGFPYLFCGPLGRPFEYFFFFSARGGEEGVRGRGEAGGVGFSLKIPRGGGVASPGGGGAEGAGGCLRRIGDFWGGGAKYFFSGPKGPPSHSVKSSA